MNIQVNLWLVRAAPKCIICDMQICKSIVIVCGDWTAGMCKLLSFAIVILGLNLYYRRISNNLYTLLIRIHLLSIKCLYSNSFIRVKMKFLVYCSYSKKASTMRWRFWLPEMRVNTLFWLWCRLYSQGHCEGKIHRGSDLVTVSRETIISPCSLAKLV